MSPKSATPQNVSSETTPDRNPIGAAILERAAEYGLPLPDDSDLAAALADLSPPEPFPEDLEAAFAALIALADSVCAEATLTEDRSGPDCSDRSIRPAQTCSEASKYEKI
ncbi:hypothetical protein [Halorhodospira abdelmalekii]|uniref:hypothetical protein n=1 Tax=Halorhodospira abdelmalekii TaxID=421629 RepID=UPI001904571B|nr:hypothetical protein [Halorhodospira abdelmalekii]